MYVKNLKIKYLTIDLKSKVFEILSHNFYIRNISVLIIFFNVNMTGNWSPFFKKTLFLTMTFSSTTDTENIKCLKSIDHETSCTHFFL